jgi:hypothetical protein
MSGDDFEVSTGLPDNPCGEEAHQMVLGQSDTVGQARITSYMAGYFDAEGSIQICPRLDEEGHTWFEKSVALGSSISQMAGVFDGEGCITYEPRVSDTCSIGFESYPHIRMKQNEDGTILEQIFETYCSHHGLEYGLTYREPKSENESNTVEAYVRDTEDIRAFLTPLLPVLCEKRRQAVIMLRELLPRHENGVHLTKPGFVEMMKWKRELDREKPMGDEDRKYTVEYFEELWADDLEAQQRLDEFGGQSEVSADD